MITETPYNEQFRNLLKFSMRKSHQIKAFGVFTGEFFQNGTCFKVLPYIKDNDAKKTNLMHFTTLLNGNVVKYLNSII